MSVSAPGITPLAGALLAALLMTPAVVRAAAVHPVAEFVDISGTERPVEITDYAVSPDGVVVARATYGEGAGAEDALTIREDAALLLLAYQGGPAGAPGRTFAVSGAPDVFSAPRIGGSGVTAFAADFMEGGVLRHGLFAYEGGDTTLALDLAQVATGIRRFGPPEVTGDESFVFAAYDNAGVRAIFALEGAVVAPIVARGSTLFGADAVVSLSEPEVEPTSGIVFRAELQGAGGDRTAYVRRTGDTFTELAATGDLAPDTDGSPLTELTDDFTALPGGGVAFRACYGDCAMRSGVFTADADGIAPVAIFRPWSLFESFVGASGPVSAGDAIVVRAGRASGGATGLFEVTEGGAAALALHGDATQMGDVHATIDAASGDGDAAVVFASVSDDGVPRVFHSARRGALGPGDVNMDGAIGADDAWITLILAIEGAEIPLSPMQQGLADADDSGEVVVADAVLILQAAVAP